MPEYLPPPLLLALVVCDSIWTERTSGTPTLLGLFSEIESTIFPVLHPRLAIHVCMTDAHGNVPIRLQLVDADEEHAPIFRVEREIEFPDRRAIITMNVQVEEIAFPSPGEYHIQLFGYGELILERRIVVHQVEA